MFSNPLQETNKSKKNKDWARDIVQMIEFIPLMDSKSIRDNDLYYRGKQSTAHIKERLEKEVFSSEKPSDKKSKAVINNHVKEIKPNKFLQSMLQILHGENMSKDFAIDFQSVDRVSNPHKKELKSYLKNAPILNQTLLNLGSQLGLAPKDIKKIKMNENGEDPLEIAESLGLNTSDDDDIDLLSKTKFKPKQEIIFKQSFEFYRNNEIGDKVNLKDLIKKSITQSHICYRIYRSRFNGLPVLKIYDCDMAGVSQSNHSDYRDSTYAWVKERVRMGDFISMIGNEASDEFIKKLFTNNIDIPNGETANSYYTLCCKNGTQLSLLNKHQLDIYYITVKTQNSVKTFKKEGGNERVESTDYTPEEFETENVRYEDTVYSFYYLPSLFSLFGGKADECIFQLKEVYSFFRDPEYNDKPMSDICIFKIQDGVPLIENAKEHIDNLSLLRHKYLNELYELRGRNFKINIDQITEVADTLETDEVAILNAAMNGFNFFKTFDQSTNEVTKSGSYGHSSESVNPFNAILQAIQTNIGFELDALRRSIGFNETRDVASFNRSDIVSLSKIAQGQSYFSTSYIDFTFTYIMTNIAKRCTYITQQILSDKEQLGFDLLMNVLGNWAITDKDFKDLSIKDVGLSPVHKLSEPEKEIIIQHANKLTSEGVLPYTVFVDLIHNKNIKEVAIMIDYYIAKARKQKMQESMSLNQQQLEGMNAIKQSELSAKQGIKQLELQGSIQKVITEEMEKLKADIERNNQKHVQRLEQGEQRKNNRISEKVAEAELQKNNLPENQNEVTTE